MMSLDEALKLLLSGKIDGSDPRGMDCMQQLMSAAMAFNDIQKEAKTSGFVTSEEIERRYLITSGMMMGIMQTSKYLHKLKENTEKPVGRKRTDKKEEN